MTLIRCCAALLLLVSWVIVPPALAQDEAPPPTESGQTVSNPPGVPEPAIVPRSWDLDFQAQPLRSILIQQPSGDYEAYWFLAYRIVNNTGQERQFVPEFIMATDKGDVLDAGVGVPPHVFEAIKTKLGNPLLERPNQVIGRILQGSDFARESIAVWRHPGHDIDSVRIFASGLSGETIRIANPLTNEPIVLRKSWMQSFDLPGTPTTIDNATVLPGPIRWVMR